ADQFQNFDPSLMGTFDAEKVKHFDPSAMAGFDADKFRNFDPAAMAGFDAEKIKHFDPVAMAGFDADKFRNFDPAAMAGFDPTQVEHFDPAAMAGFDREQMTHMDTNALAAFNIDQVTHLDEVAKQGIGDKVPEFANFDIDVRKEFIGDDALRLGGVGSFEELAAQLTGTPPTPEELAELGWDKSFDGINFDSVGGSENLDQIQAQMPDFSLQQALAAFGGTPPIN
ncbi:MAG: hypothetical protein HQ477_07440, partial [Chloroflexi bacterium]|nr:hypothetical protein [Chloroflexota bacterium]